MILVPASGREEPENEKMSELDQEMSAILKNPKLSTKEKVEMYNEVLRRNLIFEQRLLQKPIGNNDNNKIEMPISSNSNLLDTTLPTVPQSASTSINSSVSIKKESPMSPLVLIKKNDDDDDDDDAYGRDSRFENVINKRKKRLEFNDDDDDDSNHYVNDDDVDDDKTADKIRWEEFNPNENYYKLRGNSKKIDYFEAESSMQRSEEKKKKRGKNY